jgi:MCP family monocarboxylic acid transporter-like MFS transporter 14
VLCGVITSLNIPALHVNNVCIIVGGVFTMVSGLYMKEWFQFVYAVFFGICIASFSALRSTIVVDFMGVEKLTNAFGALMLFQGIA